MSGIQAQLIPNAIQQFFDSNGAPLAGGKLFSYDAGTTTPRPTFTDATGGIQNTNPIILDSEGRCEVWMDNGGYKFVLEDASNVLQWTVDQIFMIPPGFVGTVQIADGAVTTAKIADGAVTTAKIPDNAIVTSKIPNGAITTPKIGDGNVTIAKIDPNLDVSQLNKSIEEHWNNQQGAGWRSTPQYPWSAPVKMSNPNTIPGSLFTGISWHPTEEYVAVAGLSTTPRLFIYQRFGSTFLKLPDSGTPALTNNCNDVNWSADGKYLIVAGIPATLAYVKDSFYISQIFTGSSASSGKWSRNGDYFATARPVSPWIGLFQRIAQDGTANKQAPDPSFLPPFTTVGMTVRGPQIAWSPSSRYLAIGGTGSGSHPGTNDLRLYQVDPTPTMTDLGGPPSALAGSVADLAFSSDEQILACAINFISQPLVLYSFAAGVITQLATPATIPGAAGTSVAWHPNGQYLAVGSQDPANRLIIYKRSGTTFTALAAPVSPPVGNPLAMAWSPTGQFLAIATDASPYIQIFQTASLVFQSDSVPWVRSFNGD